MRIALVALFLFATSVFSQPLPGPTPKPTATAIAAKAGEIIVVAPTAKAVDFSWDKIAFPITEKRAIVDGNKLYLTTTVNGRYVVVVADYEAKTQTEWLITVTGGSEPPVVPPVVPPVENDTVALKLILAAIKDLQTRVAALEGKPVPPVNAVAAHITYIGAEMNAAARAVDNDPDLRTFFKNANVKVHVMKAEPAKIAAQGMTIAVQKAGGAPCVVVQDELGNVIGQGPMASVDAVKTLASQFIRR